MMFHIDLKLNSQNYTRVEGNQTKPVCYIMTHEEEKKTSLAGPTWSHKAIVVEERCFEETPSWTCFLSWVLFKTQAVAKLGQKWSPVRPSSDLLQPWGCTANTNCRIFPACWLNLPARQELTLSNMATQLLTAAHDFCFSTQPFVQYTTYTDDTTVFDAECLHWTSSRNGEIGGVISARPQV